MSMDQAYCHEALLPPMKVYVIKFAEAKKLLYFKTVLRNRSRN
jgi:hypothetical protein